jgi:hypothetical protein
VNIAYLEDSELSPAGAAFLELLQEEGGMPKEGKSLRPPS